MSKAPYPITPELVAVSMVYKNNRMIADEVLPRVPVGKQEFRYLKHRLEEGFTLPDTRVGRKSKPSQVEFSAVEVTDACEDYGLEDKIPWGDIKNAPEGYDPRLRAVEGLTDLIFLDREKRVADLVFDPSNYPTTQQITLAGTAQWSDPSSDPIGDIMTALDAPIIRPNIMVIGRAAYSKLIQHAEIIKAVQGNAGDSGIAKRAQVAELFELDEVLVGEGWLNTSKKGQSPTMARVWGKHCALIFRDKTVNSSTSNRITWGITAEFGERLAGEEPDRSIGLRGGLSIRVGESVKEVITASDVGYFIQDCVA